MVKVMQNMLMYQPTDYFLEKTRSTLGGFVDYSFSNGIHKHHVSRIIDNRTLSFPTNVLWITDEVKFTFPKVFPKQLPTVGVTPHGLVLQGNNLFYHSKEDQKILLGTTLEHYSARYSYPLHSLHKKINEHEEFLIEKEEK